jgi:nicotinamidase-related amidase
MSFHFVSEKTVEVPKLKVEDEVILEPFKTALIIVDMQNDFVREDGSLYVPAAKDTINNIKSLIERARDVEVKIVYTQDTHFEDDLEWLIWPVHCKKGTRGWNFIEELKPQDHDLIIEKNRYDGFYETPLEHYLGHVWNVKNLIITGTVSNICVAHTAASAGLRWYKIIIPSDGISSLTDFDHMTTLRQVSTLYAGKIVQNCANIKFA